MKKRKKYQLNLFDSIEISFEETVWKEFKIIVEKLKKSGFKSISEDWWRSRYYENLVCPGHSKNKKGFQYQNKVNKTWFFIWENHKLEIIK